MIVFIVLIACAAVFAEAADIFKTARYNNFAVGSVVIDAILAGTL